MDNELLRQYKTLVEFLGTTLGPDFEIVLHDLTDTKSVVAIANNQISGREVGSPLTDAALHLLSSKAYEEQDFISNYNGVSKNNKALRSSTMFIKNEKGIPIGLLCINFDDSRFENLKQQLSTLIHPNNFLEKSIPANKPDSTSMTENFFMDIPTLMAKLYEEATDYINLPSKRLNQAEKRDIVNALQELGMFQLKGAIPFVAKKLACSSATIYRYLSEISVN